MPIETRKMMAATLLFILLTTGVFFASCAEDDRQPLPKRNRILAVKANLGEAGGFEEAFRESLEVGSETQVLPLDWSDLETAPGVFEPTINFLAIANVYYPTHSQPIHLALRPIHTTRKAVPADLADKDLDDPQTIQRFKRLLDWVAEQIPNLELTSLVIGSEVDIFLWGNVEKWQQWTAFYAAVAPYARRKFPETLIVCETTAAAFSGSDLIRSRELHSYGDAVGVSYYPMTHNLSRVEPPSAVHLGFETVIKAIPEKPILYYQIGYPSSPELKSSPEMQAAFISEAFLAWDKHAERILFLNFQWMHETPPFGLDQFAEYYEIDTPQFRAFLGSLGLQSWSGTPKPAWEALKTDARARGFGGF